MSTQPVTTVGASDELYRTVTGVAGVSFVILGILGFIPGIIDYDDLAWAGTDSTAEAFGLFRVSGLHNLIHLLYGVVGLGMSRRALASQAYLIVGGFIFLILTFWGFFAGAESPANFLPFNEPVNWTHLIIACVMMAMGMSLTYGRGEIRRRYGLR